MIGKLTVTIESDGSKATCHVETSGVSALGSDGIRYHDTIKINDAIVAEVVKTLKALLQDPELEWNA